MCSVQHKSHITFHTPHSYMSDRFFTRSFPAIGIVVALLAGCATQSLQTHRGSAKVPASEQAAFSSFQLPIKAKPDQIVVYVVHLQEDRDKPYRKTVGYRFDDSAAYSLPSEMHSVHTFSSPPKLLKLDGICNDSDKFESQTPADGIIPLNHPYALRRQTEIEVLNSFQLGRTYVIQLSPFCFKNIYAGGGPMLSKGTATQTSEELGKYLVFKSKQITPTPTK